MGSKKKVISTRLGLDEIRFLRKLGHGDLSAGVRVALERAGYEAATEQLRGYRVIREEVSQNGERGSRYSLLLNGEIAGNPLIVSDSIFNALVERHGLNYVMNEVIVKSFVKLPEEVQVDRIYDLDGKVVWSKYE